MSDSTTDTVAETKTAAIRKSRVGEVVSTKMQKTIVVQTVTRVPHAKFGKIVKRAASSTRTIRRHRARG